MAYAFGIDYEGGPSPQERLSPQELKDAGVTFVCRYVSVPGWSKNITLSEAQELSNAGINIVLVFETSADRALGGYSAGHDDAWSAKQQATLVGMPDNRPIYFAVDFDATPEDQTAINAYLSGASAVLGKQNVGIYGGYWPVSRAMDAGVCSKAWQTYAWSGGNWYPRNNIEQYQNNELIAGRQVDYDDALTADFGQWRIGYVPPTEEDEMPQGQLNYGTAYAKTSISIKPGIWHNIGFACDNGLMSHPPVSLRIAQHLGGGNWSVKDGLLLNSATNKTTYPIDPKADELSIMYEDDGLVPVGYDYS